MTPAVRARIKELLGLNWTPRAIVKDLGGVVTTRTIELQRARLQARTAQASVSAKAPASAPLQVASVAERLLGEDVSEFGLPTIVARLRSTTALVEMTSALIPKNELAPATHVALVKLESDLAERIENLRPKPPPDPELDPANVEATRRVVAKIADMVKRFEELRT